MVVLTKGPTRGGVLRVRRLILTLVRGLEGPEA